MNIYQRINALHKQVRSIVKEGEIEVNSNSSYTVVTYDSVVKLLHMPFAENGIVPVCNLDNCTISTFEKSKEWQGKVSTTTWYRADVSASIKFINCEDPQDFFISHANAYAFDTSDKATGKAYTMALKMILMKIAMLESRDEEESRDFDDANYKEKKQPVNIPKPPPKPIPQFVVPKVFNNTTEGELNKSTPKVGNDALGIYQIKVGVNTGKQLKEISKDILHKYVENVSKFEAEGKELSAETQEDLFTVKKYLGV